MSTQIEQFTKAPNPLDDQEVFDVDMARHMAEELRFVDQANALGQEMQINADVAAALILAMALPQFAGTSTSSVTVGTGARTFTQAGKGWLPGQIVVVSSGANYVKGTVTDYISTDLELNVTSINGSGTYAAWSIGLSYDGLALAKSGVNPDITKLTGITDYSGSLALQNFRSGLRLSPAGGSATMPIGAGVAMDSTSTMLMQLPSAINKSLSAWAVGTGNGGKSQAGAAANNTWHHPYLMWRPDTGVADVCFSTNPNGLAADDYVSGGGNVPDAYTKFRRIGSGKTNGSGQWLKIIQDGKNFQLDVPVLDVDAMGPGDSAVPRTLGSVPSGVRVKARFNYGVYDAANAGQIQAVFSDLSVTDAAPSTIAAPLATSSSYTLTNVAGFNSLEIWTNTNAQIRSRISAGSGTCVLKIATLGWYDPLGEDM